MDPFADPAHDINNPLRYIPRQSLTGIAMALYFLVATVMAIFMVKSRYRARYMLCIVVGGYCEFALFVPVTQSVGLGHRVLMGY